MTRTRTKKFRSSSRLSKITRPDWLLFALVIGLTLFGLLMVFDASVVEAYQQFEDKFFFVRRQAISAALGLVGFFIASQIKPKAIARLAPPFFAIVLCLLLIVLVPGVGVKAQGARRWINLGAVGIQPSEIAKLAATLYFASWLSSHQRFAPFAVITGLLLGLIMLQPDLGTGVIISLIAFSLYFLSGAPLKYLGFTAAAGAILGSLLIVISPYRLNRLKTFLDPNADPLGTSYHIRQVLIALGSGGWVGQGIGRSRQKYQYLPEATSDSIFAIIAEETGFIGASLVIIALSLIIYRGLSIALKSPDQFSQLVAGGITAWIGLQTIINIAAMVALVPLTGVPLPFISYGGSSLISTMTAMGVLFNLSQYSKSKTTTSRLTR